MQRDVRELAIRHGIALLGPNCMGLVDLTKIVYVTTDSAEHRVGFGL